MDSGGTGTLAQWHMVRPRAVLPGLGLVCACGRCPEHRVERNWDAADYSSSWGSVCVCGRSPAA
eukprot:984664-Alexandrium_andersonii.AAC.1